LSLGLIGKKSGMSRVFQEDGDSIPVSIVSVLGNYVAGIKTKDADGYDAVLVSKTENKKNLSKSQKEFFAKVNVAPGTLNEFKLSENPDRSVGDHLAADLFEVGQHVDVTGTSKGKGYAGVIKRHNFKKIHATHGNSLSHRAHGSIGQCQTPGRVWKGKKMSGHMGSERKTIQNLEIINVDVENNLLFIKGAIPGFNGSKVTIKPSIKK
jgi:large subunit ribosomal protein L3